MYKRSKWALFLIIFSFAILGQLATEIYLPSMPAMANYFSVELSSIQFSITMYVLGYSLGAMAFGALSDIVGRKPVAFIGLIIGGIGSLLCCVATDIQLILIGRLIQGVGYSGLNIIARSIIKDVTRTPVKMAKFASFLGVVASLSIAIAPVIGGYIQKYAFWKLNFIILFILTVGIAILAFYKFKETIHYKQEFSFKIFTNYYKIITNKRFIFYNLISSFAVAGIIGFQTISSYLLQVKVGLSPEEFGYTAVLITFCLVISGVISSRLVVRRGINKMINLGCYLFTTAGILSVLFFIFWNINLISVLLPIMIFIFGAGFIYPSASSGSLGEFPTNAGSASAIYTFLQMLSATLSSSLVSIVTHSPELLLGVMYFTMGAIGVKITKNLIKNDYLKHETISM